MYALCFSSDDVNSNPRDYLSHLLTSVYRQLAEHRSLDATIASILLNTIHKLNDSSKNEYRSSDGVPVTDQMGCINGRLDRNKETKIGKHINSSKTDEKITQIEKTRDYFSNNAGSCISEESVVEIRSSAKRGIGLAIRGSSSSAVFDRSTSRTSTKKV